MSTSENSTSLNEFYFESFFSKPLHWQANEGRSLNAFLSKLTSKMGKGTSPFHPVKKRVFSRLNEMSAGKIYSNQLEGGFFARFRSFGGFGLDSSFFHVLIRSLCLRLFSRLKINFKIHDYLVKLFDFILTHHDRTWDRFHL